MRIGIRLTPARAYAALVEKEQVLGSASVPLATIWTEPLAALLHELSTAAPAAVDSVTWDVSAVFKASLEQAAGTPPRSDSATLSRRLRAEPVAAVRVVPRRGLPGANPHPAPLVGALVARRDTITGGHDLFGNQLAELDLAAADVCAENARSAGLTTLAITATGAAALATHEEAVAARLLELCPDLRLCLSHEAGGLGLLEREATTVVNAAPLDVAQELVTRSERATRSLGSGRTSCWFATGDGGRVPAERLRRSPVSGLAAGGATALIGAAALSGSGDALVVLAGASGIAMGQIREGLPHVESDLPGPFGVRMSAPQPVLTVSRVHGASAVATLLNDHSRRTTDVVAVLDEGCSHVAQEFHSAAGKEPVLVDPDADLRAVGAACTEPGAWLDLLVAVQGTEELDQLQTRAEQQARTLVAANGASPGSERIVRSAATVVGYLHASLYRLQVRASSSPEPKDER